MAERIRPGPEFFAGESVTIPWAVIDMTLDGACKDGAGRSQYSLLRSHLFLGRLAFARPACGADFQKGKPTDVTINATGPGWHQESIPPNLLILISDILSFAL